MGFNRKKKFVFPNYPKNWAIRRYLLDKTGASKRLEVHLKTKKTKGNRKANIKGKRLSGK